MSRRFRAQPDEPAVLLEAGGPVDEARVTLAIYGESLEPEVITEVLGSVPTSSHRKGERKSARSPRPFDAGAWLLTVEGHGMDGPEEVTERLLGLLPSEEDLWRDLAAQYEVQLRYGIHFDGWNRGFELSPGLVRRVAALHATVLFDIYAYPDEAEASDG